MEIRNKKKFGDKKRENGTIKKLIFMTVMVVVGLVYVGCGSGPKEMDYDQARTSTSMEVLEEANKEEPAIEDGQAGQDSTSTIAGQQLIKTGNISLEVDNAKDSYNKIVQIVKKNKGYIFGMNEYNNKNTKEINFTLKVDSKSFEIAMKELEEVGKVKNSGMNTQDVTREYIDTKARIDTLTIQEETLKQLLQKADKVEDLLKIETELQRVRENIEAAQGQMNYLKDAVAYSTIDVFLVEKAIPTETEKGNTLERFVFSLRDGLGFWTNVLLDIVVGIIWLLPVIVLVGLGYFGLRKPVKNWREKRKEKERKKL